MVAYNQIGPEATLGPITQRDLKANSSKAKHGRLLFQGLRFSCQAS